MPWLPVAFGLGIAVYFTGDREPALWTASALALAATVVAVLTRRRAIAFPLALGLAAMGLGLAVSTLHTARIAHQILQRPISSAVLAGFVEIREERERSDRIVLRVQRFEAAGVVAAPERVRVAVRKGSAPAWVVSWSSRLICRRRYSLCVPVDTTSRVTCISSASAPQATHSVQSK
jgi:competence protein ComEC